MLDRPTLIQRIIAGEHFDLSVLLRTFGFQLLYAKHSFESALAPHARGLTTFGGELRKVLLDHWSADFHAVPNKDQADFKGSGKQTCERQHRAAQQLRRLVVLGHTMQSIGKKRSQN